MPGWQYREGAFVYESPGVTVTIDQHAGPAAAVPAYRPDLADALPGCSPFLLWEWAQYRFTVAPPLPGIALHVGDQIVRPVADGVYLFRYENALGASRIRLAGAPVPDLPVEVISHKLAGDGLASYPRLYRTMVRQIIGDLLTLPFHLTGATAHATRIHDGPPSPLFTLHFLRHHGRTLAAALEAVGHSPHRVLTREELVRPVAMATRLDGAALRWGLTHPDSWAVTAGDGGWFRLGGQAVLPERLLQQRAEETFDTHENRFVRHFLLSLRQAVDDALTLLERYGGRQSRLRAVGTVQTDPVAAREGVPQDDSADQTVPRVTSEGNPQGDSAGQADPRAASASEGDRHADLAVHGGPHADLAVQGGPHANHTGPIDLREELTTLAHHVDEALAWPWWDEVGELVHLPEQSTVLHGKDGYRELWALYPEFLLGRSPFGYGLDRAIAARDVATLYEYWCFFRLIRALEPALGPARLRLRADETGGLDWRTAAFFGDGGWRLVFNLPARGGRESYSLGLRPDFTLIGPAGVALVLDAKFRLDAPRPDLDEPDRAEASPQAADLYKMHTYRDALGVRAAVALYPGDLAVFYDRRTRRRRTDLTLHELIFGDFEGVGALPLRAEGGTEPCMIS
ncbi:DUF2357 domain-containing protein [Symbiobacterium terraclitae]|uniref:DUF2357 domain-containing protein n=1 Tax=Symbiobacterium terraclitae TaxID=557451 RepID=UPI0035B54E62